MTRRISEEQARRIAVQTPETIQTQRAWLTDDPENGASFLFNPQDLAADLLDLSRELAERDDRIESLEHQRSEAEVTVAALTRDNERFERERDEARAQLAAARGRVDYEAAFEEKRRQFLELEESGQIPAPFMLMMRTCLDIRAIVDAALRAADGAKCESAAEASRIVVAEGGWDARLGKVDVGHHWLARSTALDQRWVRVELIPVIPDPKDATIAAMRTQPTAARQVGWTVETLAEAMFAADHHPGARFEDDPEDARRCRRAAEVALSRAGSPFAVTAAQIETMAAMVSSVQRANAPKGDVVGNVLNHNTCESIVRAVIAACEGEGK